MSQATKERPILFSAPMVRALLAGTKTQTRRVVKPQPDAWTGGTTLIRFTPDDQRLGRLGVAIPCPYGQPSDRLWVRETWAWSGDIEVPEAKRVEWAEVWFRAEEQRENPAIRWRPSIHMPRWASRIMLEITEVRVERLQDISEADALAEGVRRLNGRYTFNDGLHESRSPVESYRALWESINGAGSWDANPWVWAVSFRRPAGGE